MDKENSDSISETTSALNQSGSFLQIHVMNILEKFEWSVDPEHPVESAPFVNDPMTHPTYYQSGRFQSEYFTPKKFVQASVEYQNKIELEETSIDVVAGKASEDRIFKLCIECKNLNPDYSDWIFFRNKSHKGPMNLITKSINKSIGFVSLFKIPGTTQYGSEIHIELNKFSEWDPLKHLITNFSVALANKKIDKITYQSRKNLVDNAARQIIIGMYGFIIESIFQQVLTSQGYQDPTTVFIPIIVTSANLKICEIDSEQINPRTGYVEKEPTYVETDSIIYQCAPPKSVRFPHSSFAMLSPEHKKEVSKWHILILTPNGFAKFLSDLKSTDLVR